MATRIIKRPSIKIEVKDGKYKPFIFDNGKKCYLCNSDEPEPPTPPVPPIYTNRLYYTVVEGGSKPESTWITTNCSDNVFDAETGEGYLVLNEGVTTLEGGYIEEPEELEYTIFKDYSGEDWEDDNVKFIVIPSQITSIGEGAFAGCVGLTSITIPDSVTSISEGAFSGCSSLTSVIIPDSVIYIGRDTFAKCSGLTSITIGNSVTSIGDSAFYGCVGLTSVTCFATTPPTLDVDVFEGINTTTCSVPSSSISAYEGSSWYNNPFTTFVAIPENP